MPHITFHSLSLTGHTESRDCLSNDNPESSGFALIAGSLTFSNTVTGSALTKFGTSDLIIGGTAANSNSLTVAQGRGAHPATRLTTSGSGARYRLTRLEPQG